jgi:hypothetical protein
MLRVHDTGKTAVGLHFEVGVDGVFGGGIWRCIEGGGELVEEDNDDRRRVGDKIEEGIDGSFAGEVVGEGDDEADQNLTTGRRERVFSRKDRRVPPAMSMSVKGRGERKAEQHT